MKNYRWRFYRFRRKHKGWYLSLSVGVLGLLASLMIVSGLRFFYPKGIEAKATIPVTSHQTLAGKPQSSSRPLKKQISSQSSSAVATSSEAAPQISASTTVQNPTLEPKAQRASNQEQPEVPSVSYTATVGDFTRTSSISQEKAQTNAQAAYYEQLAQERVLQQSAEDLKTSIEQENPDTQVNIIQEGK